MGARLQAHDCFGVILRSTDGVFAFVSADTGKIYATLDRAGLKIIKGSGRAKEVNIIPLKALKTLIAALEKTKQD